MLHAVRLDLLAERPVLTAVVAALIIASSGILVKLADVPPATAAVFRCAYALPFLFLLAGTERRAYGPRAASQVRWAWLAGIVINLVSYPGFYDVALRDFGLMLAALSLARLASVYDPPWGRGRARASG